MDVSRYIVALMASVMFVVLTVAAARKCQLVHGLSMYTVTRKLLTRILGWPTILTYWIGLPLAYTKFS